VTPARCLRYLGFGVIAALVLATVACGGGEKKEEAKATAVSGSPAAGAAAPAAKKGGTLRVYGFKDSGIGNPILNKWAANGYAWPLFDPLVEFDDKGVLQPSLAKSWQWSPDNKSVTFQLADNVKWHDGRPFTADDVAFTMDAIKDEKTNTPHKSRLKVGDNFATWTVLSPTSIKFDLPAPYAVFLANLNEIAIVPKHLLSGSTDINTDAFNRKPVGTGPFKLTEYKQDEFMALEANKEYFKGPPNLDRIILAFYAEPDAAAAALLKGDIDAMYAYPEQQPQFEKDKKFRVHRYAYHQAITLSFNLKDPILQDKKVRQAIALAVDKKSLMETVTRGQGEVAQYLLAPKGSLGPWANKELTADEFSVAKAKQLLDEAGWKAGSDGIRAKDGTRLSLSLPFDTTFDEYKEGATILERQLREVGVEIKVRAVQRPAMIQLRQDPNADPRERSLELQEWPHTVGPFDPDLYFELHSAAQPPAGQNYMYFKNARMDQLLEQARGLVDPDKRRPLYNEAQKIIKDEVAYLPLYYVFDAFVYVSRLKGIPDDTLRTVYSYQRFSEKLWLE
jgi:peptide/nickel transport system substrate-binding protein